MARTLERAALALLTGASLLRLFISSPTTAAVQNFPGDVWPTPPMVLPLYSPIPNPSSPSQRLTVSDELHRRQLHTSEHRTHSARMRLHDGLLLNGYYSTRLLIGTPPQSFALIVDTGSTVTYVPCSTCKRCGWHQDPRFMVKSSKTYQSVKCNPGCNCDSKGVQCIYARQYAELSSSSGVLGEDIISFGDESELSPQRAIFGCENVETGDLYSQHADGIMGLGRGRLSIMDQLVQKHVIGDSFSLCYGGMDVGGGAMVLGALPPPHDMVFSRSDPHRSPYYNIELKEIHVAGIPLQLNPGIFDKKQGTVLDSGTTHVYLPELAFVAFKGAIMKKVHHLKQIHGPDPKYNDVCFSGAGRNVLGLSKSFPEVAMVFNNGQKLLLTPENYLFRHTKVHGAYCLGIFSHGDDQTTLLGGILVRNTLVTYDRENERIGFWKTNCSELWKRQHAPVSPAALHENTTHKMPPSLAPSGLPPSVLPAPGDFQVGLIKFVMSFTVNNSSMRPNFTELARLIANELEVNTSQVHLLNSTFRGNDYLVGWAVCPAQSADYISNTTVVSIIQRLAKNHIQLPPSFGSYRLVKWDVEPHIRKTWWQQHSMALLAVISVTLVLGLFTFGILLVRRRRQNLLTAYRPVHAILPEQELQPL